jgi:hypothetical protein
VGTASGFDGATGMIAGFGAGSAGFCCIVGATTVFGNGFVEGDGDGVGVGVGDGVGVGVGIGVGVGVGVGAIGEVFGTTLGVTKGRGFPALSATVGVTIVLGNSGWLASTLVVSKAAGWKVSKVAVASSVAISLIVTD